MAENITTLLELLDAGTLSDDDVIYIVHGSGSNRDRKLKLSALQSYCGKVSIDADDSEPGFLTTKFNTSSSPEFGHGDVRFLVVDTRGGRQMSTEIRSNRITTDMLKDGIVTNAKLATNSVTPDKISSVTGTNLEFSSSSGTKTITISHSGGSDYVTKDVVTFNPVAYRGIYDFTVGFKNIPTYPFSHAVLKLVDDKDNLVASFDFSDYQDNDWHYGRMTGRYSSISDEYVHNLFLKLEADDSFSGSRSPQVSWCGFVIA